MSMLIQHDCPSDDTETTTSLALNLFGCPVSNENLYIYSGVIYDFNCRVYRWAAAKYLIIENIRVK